MSKKYLIIFLILLSFVNSAGAAITGALIVTNLASTDRIQTSVNGTFNISFTESAMTNYTNFSFASEFGLGGLQLANITNNTGANTSMIVNRRWVNITYTALAAGLVYFNFTSNVQAPATSGTYAVTITTNATQTPTTVYLCARDATKPFFLSANNSVFITTCGTPTETFGTTTTSISLSGKGVSNLTFLAPNITGQTNITVGYGATNAALVRASYTGDTTPNNTIYIETDGSVTNPVIALSAVKELQSSNLPAALIAGGAITVLIYVYRQRIRPR